MINEDMCIASSPPARLSVAAADGAAVHAHAAVLAAAPVVARQLHGVTRALACFILFAVAHEIARAPAAPHAAGAVQPHLWAP